MQGSQKMIDETRRGANATRFEGRIHVNEGGDDDNADDAPGETKTLPGPSTDDENVKRNGVASWGFAGGKRSGESEVVKKEEYSAYVDVYVGVDDPEARQGGRGRERNGGGLAGLDDPKNVRAGGVSGLGKQSGGTWSKHQCLQWLSALRLGTEEAIGHPKGPPKGPPKGRCGAPPGGTIVGVAVRVLRRLVGSCGRRFLGGARWCPVRR